MWVHDVVHMNVSWERTFAGVVEGRMCEVWIDRDSSSVRVSTVQKSLSADPTIPHVVDPGTTIFVDADDPDDLEAQLRDENEFSAGAAQELANHARRPAN